MRDLPAGTVTFLFTDIEGSTRLIKEVRDEYGQLLGEHRRLLREAFAAHQGHVVDMQGMPSSSFSSAHRRLSSPQSTLKMRSTCRSGPAARRFGFGWVCTRARRC